MNKSKTFCAMPFVSTMVNSDGKFKYCCIAEGGPNNTDLVTDGKTLHVTNSKLLDAFNSDSVRDVRKKMIAGEEVEACSKCNLQSKIGRDSYKDMMTREWVWRLGAEKIEALVKEAAANDGIIEDVPVYLDLRLGNLCNFRCRMCNPYNSSSIAKEHFDLWEKNEEYQKIYQSEYGGNPVHLKDQGTWFESEMLWDQVEALIPSLKKVYMTGGEPTLIENNYYFMEKCIEMGRKDIVLFFNTNCSNLTDKFLDILSKFDTVSINASIDGFGEMNDYIRYPSHWNKISQNFERLAQMKNIQLGITPVVQIYNMFDIDKIIDYVFDVNERYKSNVFIDFLIDTKPKNLDVKILPQPIKDAAKVKLENYLNTKFLGPIHDMTKNSTYAIINLLKEDRIANADFYVDSFRAYTKILDENRKQKFEEVCVELNQYLNDYYA
jgi:sulfatase maturation enzyme AslB (radical SAM superfamily)